MDIINSQIDQRIIRWSSNLELESKNQTVFSLAEQIYLEMNTDEPDLSF